MKSSTAGIHEDTPAAERVRLADGVVIQSVTTLRADIRQRIDCEDGDCIVTIFNGRARSLVVDGHLAAFLAEFALPTTIKAAVERVASRRGHDAEQMLHDVQATLHRMRDNGFLIDSERVDTAPLAPGTVFDGLTVMAACQSLDDVEVLQCQAAAGDLLAVKLARRAGDTRVAALLEHEYTVLSCIDTPSVPRVIQAGSYAGRPYIAMQWRGGLDILSKAQALRQSTGASGPPWGALRDIAVRMLRAYADLHRQQVVHGDIHPKNILVDDAGNVHIIDFGLATCPAAPHLPAATQRSGVPYFFEPGYAASVVARSRPPAASRQSDSYGLAALSYLILAGQHYQAFSLDRDYFYRQIRYEAMRPFSALGLPSWPAVETALATVLNTKTGNAMPSPHELAGALAAADAATVTRPEHAAQSRDDVHWPSFMARLQTGGIDFDSPLRAPAASMHFGAAGIAYALLKRAEADDDAALLNDAAYWSARACHAPAEHAYVSARPPITPQVAQASSLHYGLLGVCATDALVAFAACDFHRLDAAIKHFCQAAETPATSNDLVSGTAGVLLGCALLLEALPEDAAIPARRMVDQLGQRLYAQLLPEAAGWPDRSQPANPGIAHGIAGIYYALLRWAQVRHMMPPVALRPGLLRLMDRASKDEQGYRWPTPPGMAGRYSSSWCNGAAGIAQLYCLAFESFHEAAFLDCAVGAVNYCDGTPSNGHSLCCGDAGEAYAQLAVYRLTNQPLFLQRAQALAARPLHPAQHTRPDYSLYKGQLGSHYLRFDLLAPRRARMPFFEAAGWPLVASSGQAAQARIGNSR